MADAALKSHPVFMKGRGAVSNPEGRFARERRVAADDGWSGEPDEALAPQTTVTIEHARSIISRNQSPDVFFDQSINPYRGCEHGCIYCYARPNHAYVGLSPGQDFETRLFAKPDAASLLACELADPSYRCSTIVLGTATDAYQPIERDMRITRALIETLSACEHPLSIITKSSLVERDIDLLAPMARKNLAAVYVTVTTLDGDLARRWEPRAAAPWRRLETIRRLAEAGVSVGVMVAPIVPFLNEPEIESVLEQARAAGARSAHYTVLRLPHELREVFCDWLSAHFPDRAARVLARLADLRASAPGAARGRRLNDSRFHHRMRGQGHWADLVKMRFELACRKHGLARDRPGLDCSRFVPPARDGQLDLFGTAAGQAGPR